MKSKFNVSLGAIQMAEQTAAQTKVPEPNQYWEHVKSKDRAYFIGRAPDGEMVWQCEGDSVEHGDIDWSDWHHIPGCTGWEWEPETWPKFYVHCSQSVPWYMKAESREETPVVYYHEDRPYKSQADWPAIDRYLNEGEWIEVSEDVAKSRLVPDPVDAIQAPAEEFPQYWTTLADPSGRIAYIKRVDQNTVVSVYKDGTEVDDTCLSWNSGLRKRLTKEEAAALLTPAESPDDWVTQDRVPARIGVDEFQWASWGFTSGHQPVEAKNIAFGQMHGYVDPVDNDTLHLRCKRKDLPPVPAPAEEMFPQWYILKDDEKRSWVPDWTVKRTGEETSIRYARDEAGELYVTEEPWHGAPDVWERCSEEDALCYIGTENLPAVAPAKKRFPIDLWVTYRVHDERGDWPVRATPAGETCQNWKRIQFDSNGAFIEVE